MKKPTQWDALQDQDFNAERLRRINDSATGLLAGGLITIEDATAFNVDSGAGYIINNYSDTLNPTESFIAWEDVTGMPALNIETTDVTYIAVNAEGSIVLQNIPFTTSQDRDFIYLGHLEHFNRANIQFVVQEPIIEYDYNLQFATFLQIFGAINAEGNYFSANGNNLKLNKDAGITFKLGINYAVDKKVPNLKTDNPLIAPSFYYIYRDSYDGWITASPTDVIDPNTWDADASGGLQLVPSEKWTIQYIFYYSNTDLVFIQPGQKVYDTVEDAELGTQTAFEMAPFVEDMSFRTWLLVQQGTTDLSVDASASFINAGKFGYQVSSHGGMGACGESNIASNLGVATYGLFANKVGVDLQFKSLTSGSSKLALTSNPGDVAIDVSEANIVHQNISGKGTNTHANIDSHIANTSNPHATTAAQVGLGSVTNDAQLKRSASDVHSDGAIVLNTAPIAADEILIEDSAVSFAKKKVALSNLSAITTTVSYVESEADSTVTGAAPTAYASKVSLTLAAGTYLISWSAELAHATTGQDLKARLWDGTSACCEQYTTANGTQANGYYHMVSGIKKSTLAGSTTYTIQWAKLSGTSSSLVYIRRARIAATLCT